MYSVWIIAKVWCGKCYIPFKLDFLHILARVFIASVGGTKIFNFKSEFQEYNVHPFLAPSSTLEKL